MQALALSAAFTSVAGSLYAVKTGFIDPDCGFGILVSVQMVIVAALGGAGTLFGPLIGALILIPLQIATNTLVRRRRLRTDLHSLWRHHRPDRALRAGRPVRAVASPGAASAGGAPMLLEAQQRLQGVRQLPRGVGRRSGRRRGRDHRPDRAERRRQIDLLQLPRRRNLADHRPHRLRRRGCDPRLAGTSMPAPASAAHFRCRPRSRT